ncbi:acyl-CoA thioesterase [Tundrisphaera lichenicola]|uniref:acyl-CoA thioesterase n=1 Tax=Tundrisphaera lichenicola TaxID=2029860 RepID=UPI003EB9A1EC
MSSRPERPIRKPDPMPTTPDLETLTHRLILPRDANHHGTLYAGAMLSLVLEAGYATAYRAVGPSANLVLKRVLDLRCYDPVSIGLVVEIRGREVHRARAQVVVALSGTPLPGRSKPWVDSLMQFVQVNESGRPEPLAVEPEEGAFRDLPSPWSALRDRARKLLAVRN